MSKDKLVKGKSAVNQGYARVKNNGNVNESPFDSVDEEYASEVAENAVNQSDASETADNAVNQSNASEVADNAVNQSDASETADNAVNQSNASEVTVKNNDKVKAYFKGFVKRYFITAFSGMALGLFCTLIVGTIIGQIGSIIGDNVVGKIFQNIATIAKTVMGAGIGIGIAHSLKAKKLTSFSAIVAGMLGANMTSIFVLSGIPVWGANVTSLIGIGDPVGAYFAAVFAIEIADLVEGKTPVDIIIVPVVAILSGAAAGIVLGIPFGMLFSLLGRGISMAIKWEPISFGILISVVMGLLLTFPTSSAAFGVMLFKPLIGTGLEGASQLAAAAACAGCCAHMVGFAVASFRENKWGGLISQGLGTSMLQIPNLAKNMRILIPAIAASIIAGPVTSAAFGLLCDFTGSGMGTAGLVGVLRTFDVSMAAGMSWWFVTIGVLVCYFIIPACIALGVSELMRQKNWIKTNDMLLPK